MGVYLGAVCRNNYSIRNLLDAAEPLRQQLTQLDLTKLYYPTWQPAHGENWSYYVDAETPRLGLCFEGPYELVPEVFADCVLIAIGYRYSVLYRTDELRWFSRLRRELYDLVKLFGADEVIFLADSGHYLESFYHEPAEGKSYDDVKAMLEREFGNPLTAYEQLNYDELDYRTSREYFLDNFLDLR